MIESAPRPIGPTVAATAFAVVLTGLVTGFWQSVFILRGLSYCTGMTLFYPPQMLVGGLAGEFLRSAAYGAAFLLAATPLLAVAWRKVSRTWLVAAVATAMVAGALLVVADYSAFNGIASAAKSPALAQRVAHRCPGDRPPWWPF